MYRPDENVLLCTRVRKADEWCGMQLPCKIIESKHLTGAGEGAKSYEISIQVGRLDEDSGDKWTEGEERVVRGIDVEVLHKGPMQVGISIRMVWRLRCTLGRNQKVALAKLKDKPEKEKVFDRDIGNRRYEP